MTVPQLLEEKMPGRSAADYLRRVDRSHFFAMMAITIMSDSL
jgi:hypothetical protein